MMPVGALLAGVLATALGIRAALWILTALIAASGLTFLLTPMRHLRDLPRRPRTSGPWPVKVIGARHERMLAAPGVRRKRQARFVIRAGSARI